MTAATIACRPWQRAMLTPSGQQEWISAQARAGGLAYWADSRTADAINWIFCRSSAALRGWPLAYHSQLKLRYGDHHQQPQKDCRYDELDPFPMSVEEPPVHGQPPSGYHTQHPITSHGLMTEHRVSSIAACYAPLAARLTVSPWTGRGSPWHLRTRAGGSPIWPLPDLSPFMSTR
jgi:hypothetical protein